MALLIPILEGATVFEQRMQLDGEYHTLTLRWNDRAERWYMDIGDGEGVRTASGIALVAGVPLTAHLHATAGVPPGVFFCIDTADEGLDPGLTDLGVRMQLVYLEVADTEAA